MSAAAALGSPSTVAISVYAPVTSTSLTGANTRTGMLRDAKAARTSVDVALASAIARVAPLLNASSSTFGAAGSSDSSRSPRPRSPATRVVDSESEITRRGGGPLFPHASAKRRAAHSAPSRFETSPTAARITRRGAV